MSVVVMIVIMVVRVTLVTMGPLPSAGDRDVHFRRGDRVFHDAARRDRIPFELQRRETSLQVGERKSGVDQGAQGDVAAEAAAEVDIDSLHPDVRVTRTRSPLWILAAFRASPWLTGVSI